MRTLDLYWMTNPDWFDFTDDDDATPFLTEDAPIEAKKSFERYLEQKKKTDIFKRDERVDGEYDPPLPDRTVILPQEKQEELLQKILAKHRKRTEK